MGAIKRLIKLQIVNHVKRIQRRRDAESGVLPREVQPWLAEFRHEYTIRRYCWELVAEGKLARVSERRGYRVVEVEEVRA